MKTRSSVFCYLTKTRKKLIIGMGVATVAVALSCGVFTPVAFAEDTKTIEFNDKRLCEVVYNQLRNQGLSYAPYNCSSVPYYATMNVSEIPSVVRLSNTDGVITDLTGIENFTNLEFFATKGAVTDFTPLQNMTNLTYLAVSEHQVSDLTPLSGLIKLYHLELSPRYSSSVNGQISDISPLANMTELTELYLQGHKITDLSPLANATKMENLLLSNNQITDLSPLSGMANLFGLLIDDNEVSDLEPLANLKNLHTVFFANNHVSDILPIVETNLMPSHMYGEFFRAQGQTTSDTTTSETYVMPSLYQALAGPLDHTPQAGWVRYLRYGDNLSFENAVLNDDKKSITILDTTKPAVIRVNESDDYNTGAYLAFASIHTVTYVEEVVEPEVSEPTTGPDGVADDEEYVAVPDTGGYGEDGQREQGAAAVFDSIVAIAIAGGIGVVLYMFCRGYGRR